MVLYLNRMCRCVIHAVLAQRCVRTSVHLCTLTLNHADRNTFIPLSVARRNGLTWPLIRWCETDGFQLQGQFFFIGLAARLIFVSYTGFHFSSFILCFGIVGLGSDWKGFNRSLSALYCQHILIMIIIISISVGIIGNRTQVLMARSFLIEPNLL